jgi:hypothetical protein
MRSKSISPAIVLFVFAPALLASCTSLKLAGPNQANTNVVSVNRPDNLNKDEAPSANTNVKQPQGDEKLTTGNAVAKAACMTTNVGAKRAVQKSQTFAIDFEPFKGSCFVTSYNPEYGDSHMETEYGIYQAGKRIFQLPSQFNGSSYGCWVDGVAFQDLDRDGLTDIIVVGKCEAKQADYNENMVYMNTGKAFTTREDANNQLGDFKTIKEITDFVQDNQQIFF